MASAAFATARIPTPWGKTRTVRRFARCQLLEVTLHAGRSLPLICEPRRWVYMTVLIGELAVSLNGGSIRSVEPGNRLGVPPGESLEAHNSQTESAVFTLLLLDQSSRQDDA